MAIWILTLATLVVICACLSVSSGKSIDEMIVAASVHVDDFDLLADLDTGTMRIELDMILLKEQYEALTRTSRVRNKRKAIKSRRYRWPNNVIPYRITPNVFNEREQGEIMKAIDEWRTYTCLEFRTKSSRDDDHINFDNGNGCYSYVGKVGGSQKIGLAGGCRYKGIIVHEIGHAVGFHHEQNRPDRDDHVRIMKENIPDRVLYNFKKYPWSAIETFNVPYDYTSVMHYGSKAFSINGEYTIRTVDPKHQNTIGNRKGLSFNDVRLANAMYKCCSRSISCPQRDSFLGKDCKCWCKSDTHPARECDKAEVTTTPRVTTRPISTTSTTPRPKCSDDNENCPAWAEAPQNYCKTNTYVKINCKHSCGVCGGEQEKKSCQDKSGSCGAWAEHGYCTGTYEVVMTLTCPKTCDRCEAFMLGSGTTSSPTSSPTTNSTLTDDKNKGVINGPSVFFVTVLVTLLETVFK